MPTNLYFAPNNDQPAKNIKGTKKPNNVKNPLAQSNMKDGVLSKDKSNIVSMALLTASGQNRHLCSSSRSFFVGILVTDNV